MYHIGQVVFVVLNKKQQIFPMQVIEMVTKKTLQGEEVKYCLQAGSDKTTKIMLDQLEGEIFTSADEARHTLVSRVTKQIHAMISNAEKKAVSWYGDDKTELAQTLKVDEPSVSFIEENNEYETVVLPDGQIARIRLPSANDV